MDALGIILIVIFIIFCIVGPVVCFSASRHDRGAIFDPQPKELLWASRRLSAVTARSRPGQETQPDARGGRKKHAQRVQLPVELGECPICIGPLVPAPARTRDPDARLALDAVASDSVSALAPAPAPGASAPPMMGQPGLAKVGVLDAGAGAVATGAADAEADEDASADEILTLKSCGHSFHSKCLASWFLIERHDCPVCRAPYYNRRMALLAPAGLSTRLGRSRVYEVPPPV